jgi:copper(I)-binding protein
MIVLLFIGILVSSCSSDADAAIHISDPWVRAAAMIPSQDAELQLDGTQMGEDGIAKGNGANSAAFMLIENRGSQADRLLAAESMVADAVEIHLSQMDGDVMVMRQVDGIAIPARRMVELKPGSYHIMLIGIRHDLKPGDLVEFTLRFERAATETIQAEVRMP